MDATTRRELGMVAIFAGSKRIRILSFMVVFIFLNSCAHDVFYNGNACTSRTRSFQNYHLGGLYFFGGLLTQQGECSLIRPLKIELGGIYDTHKNSLIFSLDSGGGSEIDTFASDIGCHKDSNELFKKELLKNKVKVFGEKYEKSSRQVMLGVYEMIKNDDELYKQCWK